MQCLFLTLYNDRAGTREVHNKLEKNRRAHLRECFEFLRKQLPAIDDKKLSNLGILKSALRFIQVKLNLLIVLPFLSLFFFDRVFNIITFILEQHVCCYAIICREISEGSRNEN